MSIDERLRSGLADNTGLLVPDVELALSATYDRVRSRQRIRRGVVALTAAAAVAAAAWGVDLPGSDDATPVAPDPTPAEEVTDLVGLAGRLDPGTYSLAAWGEQRGDPLPRAILEVPEGYFSNGGYVIDAGHDALAPGEFGTVQVWRVDQVLTDPCRRNTATDVGPGVADLARALVRQTGTSTRPRPVELDGHRGLTMTVTVPTPTDLTECPDGYYPLWLARPDEYLSHSDPGVVHHLWILDVEGTRLVVIASTYPDQGDAQHQELLALAESIHFEPQAA
jgi:hypothetical protein